MTVPASPVGPEAEAPGWRARWWPQRESRQRILVFDHRASHLDETLIVTEYGLHDLLADTCVASREISIA